MFSGYTSARGLEMDGMELDRSSKQHLPQVDAPLPAARRWDRGTSNHQQHLPAAGDHSQTLLSGFAAETGISSVFLWLENKHINLDI